MVVLPEPVGPVTSTMPLGRRMTSRKAANVTGSMPTDAQVEHDHAAVEHPHDDALAEHRGQHAHAEVDRVAADGQADAAVLRHAALGDVEVRHDLDPRRDGEGQVARRRHHFIEHAVGPDADLELVLERLEVQVAGVVLDRHQEHHVQQLADRGAVGHGLGLVEVERCPSLQVRGRSPGRRRCSMSAISPSTLSPPAA